MKHLIFLLKPRFQILTLLLLLFKMGTYAQTQTFPAVADAQIWQGGPDNNYGASADLLVKIQSGQSRYSYAKFDLSAYNLSTIGKATVRLYCRTKANLSINNLINVWSVPDNSWDENTITNRQRPDRITVVGSNTITAVGKYYEFDITPYVKSLNISSTSNTILSLAFSDAVSTSNTVTFNSKESTANTPPQLILNTDENPPNVYHLDSENGDDANDGLSEEKAWKSLSKANSVTYLPGSKLLLKKGGIWIGQLKPMGSGEARKPIIIDSYGGADDPKPIINGNGIIADGALKLFNQSFWEINNLEIVNNADEAAERRGVEISGANFGLLEHIYLKNLTIHNVKGTIGNELRDKRSSGIYFTVDDDRTVPTRYHDILVEGCLIYECQNQGIVISNEVSVSDYPRSAAWENRKVTNLVIRNNTIHHISKNAMIIRLADGGLVERNLCYETATGTTGNTMFSRSCINTVFQFNEGYLNRSTSFDGSMYDPDLNSPGVIFQYSYSHDNAHGLLWVCTSAQDTGVVARYNISQNDKGSLIYMNYDVGSISVYNNTFYIPAHLNLNPTIIQENTNNDHTYTFQNNIIYNANTSGTLTGKFNFAATTRTFEDPAGSAIFRTVIQNRTITNNIFYRTTRPDQINFATENQTSDPLLIDPGTGTTGLNSVGGYKLKPGSPALGRGITISNNGGKDYFGIAVSKTMSPNIGFYNGPGTAASLEDPNFHIYLLTGQSNMSGRGTISESYTNTDPRIKMLTKEGDWVTATPPIHYDPGAAVGPGLAFAKRMLEGAGPEVTIGLIPTAVGGQSISAFSPGVINTRTVVSIYDESVSRVNLAKTQGILKGILFHQGESNNSSPSSWPNSLKTLISNFRASFSDPKLPFILGEMGRFPSNPTKYINIISLMPQLVADVPYTALVSSQGLVSIGDDTHFDSPSATTLGIRYADAMKSLLATLPVRLINFNAKKQGDEVLLSWKTAQEVNNSKFIIERSTDGEHFLKIGEVAGAGTSNQTTSYSYQDKAPANQLNYYRLKQVDFDGGFHYSTISSATFSLGGKGNDASIILFPNPAKERIYINLKAEKTQAVIITIYDVQGKQISRLNFNADEDIQQSITHLKEGIYLLEARNKAGALLGRCKFIKN